MSLKNGVSPKRASTGRPHILLVNPWIHDFAAYNMWAKPMGLLVLATVLRRQGWEPFIIDCVDPDHPGMDPVKVRAFSDSRYARTPISRPSVLEHVPRVYSRYGVDPELIRKDLGSCPTPRAILVTSFMTYWYPGVVETVRLLRKAFPRVPLLLGGIYASLLPDHAVQKTGADGVITGPGESILSGTLFEHTGIRPADVETRCELECSPALGLLPRVRFLPLLTSRGCPFQCAYCASRNLVPAFVQRPVREVLREIATARSTYRIQDIALYDDAFLVNSRMHALPLLLRTASEFPDLRWHTPNGLHGSEIDGPMAAAMKSAGFQTIRIGLERSSDEFHCRTGGKTRISRFLAAVRFLRDAGFQRDRIGVYLLVGLPGQSRSQIEDDVDFVMTAGAIPRLAEYSPIPGTRMWTEAARRSPYPIKEEPLFQNCTLLPAAEPDVDWAFVQGLRKRIRDGFEPLS